MFINSIMISDKSPSNVDMFSYSTFIRLTRKTAITLTPPTVGRQSADKMPNFSSFFHRPTKNKLLLPCYIFSIGRQFWGLGNRPMICRWSADDRPISRPMSYLNEPHIIGRCVGRSSLATYHRPIVKFWD